VVQDVGGACASTGLILAMQLIHQHRIGQNDALSSKLCERIGRAAVERGALVNLLRVEPALGTPARSGLPATVAHRTPSGWRISGHKTATGAAGMHWFQVWARTDEDAPRTGAFLVPAHAPGVQLQETWDHLGLRASGSHEMMLRSRPTMPASCGRRRARSGGADLAHGVSAIEELLAVNAALIETATAAADAGAAQSGVVLNLFKTSMADNAVRPSSRPRRWPETTPSAGTMRWSGIGAAFSARASTRRRRTARAWPRDGWGSGCDRRA
jgi:hypothetical protein